MSLVYLAMVILIGGACWSILTIRWGQVALAGSLAAVAGAGALAVFASLKLLAGSGSIDSWYSSAPLPIGSVAFAFDGLSAWFALAIGTLSIAVALYSWGYFQEEAGRVPLRGGAYGALVCGMIASLLAVICAADAVLFLVAWEAMSITSFFLVGFNDKDPEARRGAWMYLIATHLGGAFGVFPLFAILVARGGGTTFVALSGAAAAAPVALAVTLFVLVLLGFGTKAGFMPLHIWLPIAHPVAPSPVSALMSGLLIKMGLYGLLRLLTWLPPLPLGCAMTLIILGIITGVMGILYALAQSQIKRMLAYSSVENMGIIALALGAALLGRWAHQPLVWQLGLAGALLHILNHSLFKGILFLSAGSIMHSTGTGAIERLGGLAKKTPLNAALFLLAAISISALPPLNGFVGEWLIYNALFRAATGPLGMVSGAAVAGLMALALIGGLALASFAKVFGTIFLGSPRDPTIHAHPTPRPMLAGMALLAAACVLIGTAPTLLAPLLARPLATLGAADPINSTADVLAPLATLVPLFSLLAAIFLGLAALRLFARVGKTVIQTVPTWGCGFPYPTSRMQYSGSSFGWNLMASFRKLLRARRKIEHPMGLFPRTGALATAAPDLALARGYEPAFRAVARFASTVSPLQRGRIHLQLVYIAGTVVALFLAEAYFPIHWIVPAPTQASPVSVGVTSHDAATENSSASQSNPGGHP